MRKTTKGKGLAGGTAVAAVVAGLALLQSLGLAAVWGALPAAFAVLALAGVAAQLAVAAPRGPGSIGCCCGWRSWH